MTPMLSRAMIAGAGAALVMGLTAGPAAAKPAKVAAAEPVVTAVQPAGSGTRVSGCPGPTMCPQPDRAAAPATTMWDWG